MIMQPAKLRWFKISIMLVAISCNSFLFADSDYDFAQKLASVYPKLALKYMTRPNGPDKDTGKKEYNMAMYSIHKNLANFARNSEEKQNHLIKSLEYLSKTNPTPLEIANANYSLATMLKLGLSDYRLRDKDRASLTEEIIPFYNKAGDGYGKIGVNLKENFTKGMDKALEFGMKFLKKPEGVSWFKNVYSPYVISKMRYFECKVERASILPKGDPRKLDGIEKLIEQANDISYELEAPIPVSTITTYAARMYNILAQEGKEPKKNGELAVEKFKEVLEMEASRADKLQMRTIKAKAILGLLENSLKTKTYEQGHESFELYVKSLLPKSYRYYTLDDYSALFDGLYINAYLFKKTKDLKYELGIKKSKAILDKQASKYAGWKKKVIDAMIKVAVIKGEKISDPSILFQVARNFQQEKKYKEAIEMYQKGFGVKIPKSLAFSLKPKSYFSLAYCAYKAEDEKIGRDALLKFFQEYPPDDKKYAKALKGSYVKSAELLNILAVRVHKKSKNKEDYAIVMDSLDLLEKYNPDKVVFKKVAFLSAAGNYIDSLKLLNLVKKGSNSFDKALYLKGLYYFKYSKFIKSGNNDEHNELSKQQIVKSKDSFLNFIEFVKKDTGDIIKEKQDIRNVWLKDTQKLLGFVYVSLEEYDNAITKLTEVLKGYKKDKKDLLHSNMIYVLQSLFLSNSKKEKSETSVPKKMELLKTCESIITQIEDLDSKVFYQYKDPEKKKKDLLSGYYKRLGIMLLNNAAKDTALVDKGREILQRGGNIKNLNIYVARIMFTNKDYDRAITSFSDALEEYKAKGFNEPLKAEDFKAVISEFTTDKDINFFKKYFLYLAVNKKKEKTRDFGRLRRNLKIIIDPKWKPKTETVEEKKYREKFVEMASKDVWKKNVANGNITTLETKLVEFLTYLGIVDDLAICYLKTNSFNKSIEFLSILKVFYPGILSEDIKLANLKYEYAAFLLKQGKAKKREKMLGLLAEARLAFIDLKRRLKKEKGSDKYIHNNERRLLTYVLLYKATKKEEYIQKVITALSIEYSNQESYAKYSNLFAVLEVMKKMPEDLMPLSPEEIRLRDKKLKAKAVKDYLIAKAKKAKYEELQLIKRNNSVTVPDYSFVDLEFSNLGDENYKKLKENIESINGIKKIEADNIKLLEVILRENFNKMLMEVDLYKKIPSEVSSSANINDEIKKIEEFVKKVGVKEAYNHNKIVSFNRDILKKCFSALPPKIYKPKK
ncbi:MAG: hypothetical protein COA79_16785 [Planctomycetota bacterium]|nr:MAG: hypothetical protein COA79_16785 [Planctomycetota bacterium]